MEILEDRKPHEDAMREVYEASSNGCVSSLTTVIKKYPLILKRVSLCRFTETPLHIASLRGHLELCKILLQSSPDLASEVDSEGRCPLHLASALGHTEVVKALLRTNPETCLARDKDDMLPLHFAAMRGRVGAIKELVKAKPDSVREMTETDDASVLHLCVRYNHFGALKLLVESVRGDHQFLSLKDRQGNSLLHLALKHGKTKIIKYLLSLSEISTEINTLNMEGLTAMDMFERYQRDFMSQNILAEGIRNPANGIIAQEPVSSSTLVSRQQTNLSTYRQQQPTSSQSITVIIEQPDPPQILAPSLTNNDTPQTLAPSLTNDDPTQTSTLSPTMNNDPPQTSELYKTNNDPLQTSAPSLSNIDPPHTSDSSQPNNDPQGTSNSPQASVPLLTNNDSPQASAPSLINNDVAQTSTLSVTNNDPSQISSPSLTNNDPPQTSDSLPQASEPSVTNNDPPQTSDSLPQASAPSLANNDPPQTSDSLSQASAPSLANNDPPQTPDSPQESSPSVTNNDHAQTSTPSVFNNDPLQTLDSPQELTPSVTNIDPTQTSASSLSNNVPPESPNSTQAAAPLPTNNNPSQTSESLQDAAPLVTHNDPPQASTSSLSHIDRSQLMVAATVIATMTFQSVISPPGGVWQGDTLQDGFTCPNFGFCEAGTAVVGYAWSPDFLKFVFFNSSSFFASLCVMLLIMSGFPLDNKVVIWILALLMIVAASCMLLTYMWALGLISPNHIYYRIRKLGYLLVGTWALLLLLVGLNQISRIVFWARSRARRNSSTNAPPSQNSNN